MQLLPLKLQITKIMPTLVRITATFKTEEEKNQSMLYFISIYMRMMSKAVAWNFRPEHEPFINNEVSMTLSFRSEKDADSIMDLFYKK